VIDRTLHLPVIDRTLHLPVIDRTLHLSVIDRTLHLPEAYPDTSKQGKSNSWDNQEII
jgi:hypothetical protein